MQRSTYICIVVSSCSSYWSSCFAFVFDCPWLERISAPIHGQPLPSRRLCVQVLLSHGSSPSSSLRVPRQATRWWSLRSIQWSLLDSCPRDLDVLYRFHSVSFDIPLAHFLVGYWSTISHWLILWVDLQHPWMIRDAEHRHRWNSREISTCLTFSISLIRSAVVNVVVWKSLRSFVNARMRSCNS